ncbi:MAG: cysteine--tRNA ligase [Burkholderiaceae bacterium]|jgi:cysteinyl-tRNA synthetase|nr:cysteine--tRNA ligase [Burkholderiaceae bacterium]
MTIEIHNTLTRRKEPLQPLVAGRLGVYVCGVTVYDFCHMGNARTLVAFDAIVRWLRERGNAVTYVRNITDVDDKIIRRAAERGITPTALAVEFTRYMQEDLAALGCATPDAEPRATDYIPQMLGIIELLEDRGLAYLADDGDVDYAVRRFPRYGRLSGKSLDDLRAGERVAVGEGKRDPLDFVLWKRAKPGEPQWDSKWGSGRPGWHIECSAMASELLGRQFDIHGGGPDLVFPHHENEIAQSEGAFEQPFANIWMHCGALRVGDDKMSKSLGNFWTIRDALAKYDGEVLRFFLLRSHYRSQVAFSEEQVGEARTGLTRLYTALRDTPADGSPLDWSEPHAARFASAMDDDFNTPMAVATLFELASEVNRTKAAALARQLKLLGDVLGLLQRPPGEFLQGRVIASVSAPIGEITLTASGIAASSEARIETLIAERTAAKKAKNFAEADRIRAQLAEEGIVLEDSATGTTWRRGG